MESVFLNNSYCVLGLRILNPVGKPVLDSLVNSHLITSNVAVKVFIVLLSIFRPITIWPILPSITVSKCSLTTSSSEQQDSRSIVSGQKFFYPSHEIRSQYNNGYSTTIDGKRTPHSERPKIIGFQINIAITSRFLRYSLLHTSLGTLISFLALSGVLTSCPLFIRCG